MFQPNFVRHFSYWLLALERSALGENGAILFLVTMFSWKYAWPTYVSMEIYVGSIFDEVFLKMGAFPILSSKMWKECFINIWKLEYIIIRVYW